MPFTHIIKFHEANQRLDRFVMHQGFATKDTLSSRSECTDAIHNGFIVVNDAKTKPSYVLKTGDIVTFLEQAKKHTSILPNPNLPLEILFENQYFLILNKPAGIAMHPIAFSDTQTVANWLIAHFPETRSVGENTLRPGIVHRLDKDTSGVCIAAKTQEAFIALKDLFKKHSVQKTYVAIVHGHIIPKKGTVDTAIARSLTLGKQAVADNDLMVRGKIRAATTRYTVLRSSVDFDVVEAQPKTGRMHQIRVHLFSIGHPIVGDKLYSTKLTRKADRERADGPKRHLLHAKRLSFTLFGEDYDFESALPADFLQFLDTIQ
ncbi:MAG: RluA family pseudouridine synthase [Candidatus Moranbacteria bacterium]|nr:RluA family pseudouridine synthase [Candidatus Moranbacteria bacterium]